MEELPGNGQAWLAWTTNDLILDEMFKHLDLIDLKHARLTCKKFATVGSRALLKKSVIRLSEFTPFIPGFYSLWIQPHKVKAPHWRSDLLNSYGSLLEVKFDLWETKEELAAQEYFRISAYRDYLDRILVFPSEFLPKKVIVYNFNDLVRLPMPHFSSVEELRVIFFKPSEAYSFLKDFHKIYPNLRSLQLQSIRSEETPFCHRLHSLLSAIQEPAGNPHPRLEQLSLALPAEFAHSDWSFLAKFRKLKVARIRWAGAYHARDLNILDVQPIEMHESYSNSDVFGQWLLATKAHLHFSSLNEVSLRFDLSAENIENILKALEETNLRSLSLEVRGRSFELVKLLEGLGPKTVAVLANLHTGNSLYGENSIREILKTLSDNGFFAKSKRTWLLSFRSKSEPGWLRLIMEEERFTVQLLKMLEFRYCSLMTHLWGDYSNMFERFNYGFSRINYYGNPLYDGNYTQNESEAVKADAFVGETFIKLFQKEANQLHSWASRQEPQKLLCDNDDFKRESCISLWNHPTATPSWEHACLSSWSFFHVPASVLSKWCPTVDIEVSG